MNTSATGREQAGPRTRQGCGAFAVALSMVLVCAMHAPAATFFTEEFSDNSPDPNMALGTPYGAAKTDFTGSFTITSGSGPRVYLGTLQTDYVTTSFEFWATVTIPATNTASMPFFGMGSHDATTASGEPLPPKVMMMIWPSTTLKENVCLGRVTGLSDNRVPLGQFATGTHRLHMWWNADTKVATFEMDFNYDGTYTPYITFSLDGSDVGLDSLNSRLIVGGGYGVSFDDIAVTPWVTLPPTEFFFFEEDFSDNTPAPNMALGPPSSTAVTTDFTGSFTITSGSGPRIYLRTMRTDYVTTSFEFWATATIPGTDHPNSMPFFGMGSGDLAPGSSEPAYPKMVMMIWPGTTLNDNKCIFRAISGTQYIVPLGQFATGTHRLHMRWNADTQVAKFGVDLDYNGTYSPNITFSLDGTEAGFDSLNSRLFLGGGYGVSFDDILVTPPPPRGTVILVQ
ncbi:MAG: hypothetical protein PHR35_19675 [Kiritimatiellae bacterium]|nr:hypothetical protein [Kiritimatiellia bacterium]